MLFECRMLSISTWVPRKRSRNVAYFRLYRAKDVFHYHAKPVRPDFSHKTAGVAHTRESPEKPGRFNRPS